MSPLERFRCILRFVFCVAITPLMVVPFGAVACIWWLHNDPFIDPWGEHRDWWQCIRHPFHD